MTAVTYLLEEKYDKAIEYFTNAEKINPRDCIVLNNLAEACIRKGDKANGIKYYELVKKYGDSEHVQNAKKRISELKN